MTNIFDLTHESKGFAGDAVGNHGIHQRVKAEGDVPPGWLGDRVLIGWQGWNNPDSSLGPDASWPCEDPRRSRGPWSGGEPLGSQPVPG